MRASLQTRRPRPPRPASTPETTRCQLRIHIFDSHSLVADLPWPWMAPVADHHVVRVHRVRLEDARALSQVEHRLERSTAGSRKKASGHGPSTHRDAGEKHMKYYSTHRGHHTYVCSHVSAVLRNIKIQKSKCMSRI